MMEKVRKIFNEKNLKKVDAIIWTGASICLGLTAIKIFNPFKKNEVKETTPDKVTYIYTYADAVDSIVNSCMAGEDKKAAIKEVSYGCDPSYYEAISRIAESNMASADIVDAIKAVKERREE